MRYFNFAQQNFASTTTDNRMNENIMNHSSHDDMVIGRTSGSSRTSSEQEYKLKISPNTIKVNGLKC